MFKKILIANRGEIALRILRACRELGIKTVAIHSEADESAMHVRMADESICVGPSSAQSSYLNIPAIITAATLTNADGIHPGYGFLSENQRFAEIIEEHNIKFIGPHSSHIKIMGNKIDAKKIMDDNNVPTVPGLNDISNKKDIDNFINKVQLPIIVKAASGGGGKGMRVITDYDDINNAINSAKAEAKKSFNDDKVYLEKFLITPKHIEIQILADSQGNVITLGERDCSIQRRHQKILEEAPSTVLTPKARQHIGEICANAIANLKYSGAGTIEFLYSNGKFYFIEMNTRIQVEHPITEQIFGVDLVKEQIRVASKEKLSFQQEKINFKGHAIECRINAEKIPEFSASPGLITAYHAPGGHGVRVDSAIYAGYKVPPYYDSLICKLIVHGETRMDAILKLRRALKELIVDGIDTTAEIFDKILVSKEFERGTYDISWLEDFLIEQQRAK